MRGPAHRLPNYAAAQPASCAWAAAGPAGHSAAAPGCGNGPTCCNHRLFELGCFRHADGLAIQEGAAAHHYTVRGRQWEMLGLQCLLRAAHTTWLGMVCPKAPGLFSQAHTCTGKQPSTAQAARSHARPQRTQQRTCMVQLVENGVEHHPHHRPLADGEADGHTGEGEAVHKVGGSCSRVG